MSARKTVKKVRMPGNKFQINYKALEEAKPTSDLNIFNPDSYRVIVKASKSTLQPKKKSGGKTHRKTKKCRCKCKKCRGTQKRR
jgi:hypothetical protein